MSYLKKTIILNEVTGGFSKSCARGVVAVEASGGKIRLSLSVFGLEVQKSGRFVLGVSSKNLRIQKFEVGQGGKIVSDFYLNPETDIGSPLLAVLVYTDHRAVVPVLFGANGNRKSFYDSLLGDFLPLQDDIEERIMQERQYINPSGGDNEKAFEKAQKKEGEKNSLYDEIIDGVTDAQDSAAAPSEGLFYTEQQQQNNYRQSRAERVYRPFDLDEVRGKTLKGAFEADGKMGSAEPTEYADNAVAAENYYPKKYAEAGFTLDGVGAEANKLDPSKLAFVVPLSFYENIKPQIDALFERYPREEQLEKRLKGTRWVKVDYSQSGKYYVVGVVGDEPSYICYGVPATFSDTPPEELEGCQWLPLDDAQPRQNGYWVLYQSAETGEAVNLNLI